MEAKRIWRKVRLSVSRLRNVARLPGKIAGKAISNLMLHRGHHHASSSAPREYEFSCSNTPNYAFHITNKHHHHNHHSHFFGCTHAPPTLDDDVAAINAVEVVLLEMLNNEAAVESSPELPGFGPSPMARQVRITDSPFPLRDATDEDSHVDKAAEDFIEKFYRELRQQKRMAE